MSENKEIKSKLGIVFLDPGVTQGGTSTFSKTMYEYLHFKAGEQCEYRLIVNARKSRWNASGIDSSVLYYNFRYRNHLWKIVIKFISLRFFSFLNPQYKPSLFDIYSSIITQKLKKTGCDFFWFVTPPPFIVDLPSMAPIYNLAHVEYPWISDFSREFEWQKREYYFTTLINKSFVIIFTDEHHAQIAKKKYNIVSEKIVIQPLPTPIIETSASVVPILDTLSKYSLQNKNYFIYPANFWEHKNHKFLIELISKLKNRKFDFKVILTGSDPIRYKKKISQIIKEKGLEEYISILNFVDRKDLIHLMLGSKAVLFPSLITPDSIPELEAAYLGVPFVKGTFLSNSVQIDKNVVSIPFSRIDFWESKLIELIENERFRNIDYERKVIEPQEYFDCVMKTFKSFTRDFLH